MRRAAIAIATAIAVGALLATSRQVREADPMPMAGPIFFFVEMLEGFKNFPRLPTLTEHLCDRSDASIFRDPDFVVTGFTKDVATGCITSLETRTR